MDSVHGYFMEPQNFSVNDGNGIRTVIFLLDVPLDVSGVLIQKVIQVVIRWRIMKRPVQSVENVLKYAHMELV